jgi:hypothetical protein
MINYKKMMGIDKKKKKSIIKEKKEPSVLDNIKKELNEWSHQPPTTKRWTGSGLTEFERKGGKDNVNEGPAGDYAKAYGNVKKTYGLFWDAVQEFEDLLSDKGLLRHAKELNMQYRKNVEKFYKFFFKMMDKLQ